MVSHPEDRAFVDQLRASSDLFIEPFPTREEFEFVVEPVGSDDRSRMVRLNFPPLRA